MDRNQKVSLGCGSLILIALIVLFFGNAEQKELGREIKVLGEEVRSLQSSIREQSLQIRELKVSLDAVMAELLEQSQPR